jgi:acyl carrier protein
MDLQKFTKKFAEQLEVDSCDVTPNTVFKDMEDWSSFQAVFIISMVRDEFEVILTGKDFRQANTIEDLYNLIISKK